MRVRLEVDPSIACCPGFRRVMVSVPATLFRVQELMDHVSQVLEFEGVEIILAIDGFALPPQMLIHDMIRHGELLRVKKLSCTTHRSERYRSRSPVRDGTQSKDKAASRDLLLEHGSILAQKCTSPDTTTQANSESTCTTTQANIESISPEVLGGWPHAVMKWCEEHRKSLHRTP
eukprot:gnl/MRDRNA2_/MRDRNA2_56818_c0_seq1.p1 gnl/MRDRNA2_/MRDRNA2_56818_c0~~gnl/MRDRNA2_/MRDRNA2_56818_c0_seq1.p1  ORF type:complete len:175 (+),score=27.12 gnl/MRDRNA2_/MRDRNA2_56818_c0_seq1:95-619(+)